MKHLFYTLSLLTLFFLLVSLVLGQAHAALSRAGYDGSRKPIAVSASGSAPNAQPAANRSVTYTYDGAGRLIAANYGDVRIVYTYDNAGNLLSRRVVTQSLYLPVVLKRG